MKTFLRWFSVASLIVVLMAATVAPASAQTGNLWQVNFWPNNSWSGSPTATQWPSILAYNWGTGSPDPSIPPDNFSARATNSGWFAAGTYIFTAQADDEIQLMIDGVVRLTTIGAGMSGKSVNVSLALGEGWHSLQVDYREFTGLAYLFLTWNTSAPTPPSGGGSDVLIPLPSATSVQTRFGDYTPCIQQGIHQKNCFVSDGAWDAPNMGSIETEPQIVFWGNCVADQAVTMQLYVDRPAQPANCSKTDAGFFPK